MQSVNYCHIHNEPVVFYNEKIEDSSKKGLCLHCIQKMINNENVISIDQYQQKQQQIIKGVQEQTENTESLLKELLQQIQTYKQTLIRHLDLNQQEKNYQPQEQNGQIQQNREDNLSKETLVPIIIQQTKQQQDNFVQLENKERIEINLTCPNVDSIQCLEKEFTIERRICKCQKEIDIDGDQCKSCLKQQKCFKCQIVVGDDQQSLISNTIYCKDCLICSQCNKQNSKDIILIGTFLTHKFCTKILQKESKLKLGILEIIRKQLSTLEMGVKNDENYFVCQKFECVEFKNYLDHVVGYHHFLVIEKIKYNPKTFKVLKSQAEQYLIEDFSNAENLVAKLLIENGKKISHIKENVLMLFICAAFIFREVYLIKPFLTSAASNNYSNLYYDLEEFKCKQIKKHNCTMKSKLKYILDFFNDRFRRKDGSIREQQQKLFYSKVSFIQKILPSKRR